MNYQIREMRRDELDLAVEWAALEGWNPGLHDADCFYATDPGGYLVGLLDGEPISSISVVKYGSYAFLGFYIVKPEHRGKGYGLQIWEEGMRRLDGCDVGLDGVLAQTAKYEKSGFRLAYQNSRYQGVAVGGGNTDPRIVDVAELNFDELMAYDASVFSMPRPGFLGCWLNRLGNMVLAIRAQGQIAGYTVLRVCREGYKVGPLFADNADFADALLTALLNRAPAGAPIFLDVPGEAQNPAATELAQRHGMQSIFSTARMYRMAGSQIDFPLHRWFGVTTLELG